MRPRLTYANVMATIAVFIALGGASYAALKVPRNSVGPRQLRKNAVRTAKVKNEAITAAKVKKGTLTGAQINLSALGTVPTAESAESAKSAQSAVVAESLPPAEAWHEVGAPGEPQFLNDWKNIGFAATPAGFYKDRVGIVHLKGLVAAPPSNNEAIFKLPPGFRPGPGLDFTFLGYCGSGTFCDGNAERVDVLGSDYEAVPEFSGDVLAYPANLVSLSAVSFRAES